MLPQMMPLPWLLIFFLLFVGLMLIYFYLSFYPTFKVNNIILCNTFFVCLLW